MSSESIRLMDTDFASIDRKGRYVMAALKTPHTVLSTSRVTGGLKKDIQYLVNHQSCEISGHDERFEIILKEGQDAYHQKVCDELGLDSAKTATMGTAANMQFAALGQAHFEEFSAWAIATAGCEGNAACAGDPATYVERAGKVATEHGTINLILLTNVPLIDAALVRTAATITEAKTAVLQELCVRSRYSTRIATGTGTDQFCIAAPIIPDAFALSWTGHHNKMGELIAHAVMDAVREALRWQDSLEVSLTRNLHTALYAFGVSEEKLHKYLKNLLNQREFELWIQNYKSIVMDSQVSAAAYALAAVKEREALGALPKAASAEAVLHQCALLAAAFAAKPDSFSKIHRALAPHINTKFVHFIARAISEGLKEKWRD